MKPYDQTKGLGSVSFNLLKRQTPTHVDLISPSHFKKAGYWNKICYLKGKNVSFCHLVKCIANLLEKLPPGISLGFRWCHAQLMNLNVILTCFFLKFFKKFPRGVEWLNDPVVTVKMKSMQWVFDIEWGWWGHFLGFIHIIKIYILKIK